MLIPQLIILSTGALCTIVAIYCFPSPQSWPILSLILVATAIAILTSVTVELLP
jgi:hypothetical protein